MWKSKERKKDWSIFLALLMVLNLAMPVTVNAQTPDDEGYDNETVEDVEDDYSDDDYGDDMDTVSPGDSGFGNGITWTYDDRTKILTVTGEGELTATGEDEYFISPFAEVCGTYEVEKILFEDCQLNGDVSWLCCDLDTVTEIDCSGLLLNDVTDMNHMFSGCINLTDLNLSGLNTSDVADMSGLFAGCESLTELDLSDFDTSSVLNMSQMFAECTGLAELDLSVFDTASVEDMSGMFFDCYGLTDLDISSFDTNAVINMTEMFNACSALETLDLSNLDTAGVEMADDMFDGCTALKELDLSNCDFSNLASAENMLLDCTPAVIKTPQELTIEIELPVSYWDEEAEEYTVLSEENTNMTLTKQKPDVVKFKITYVLNGGKNHSDNPKTGKSTNPDVKLKNPTRTGYTFKGWYQKIDGKNTKVTVIPKGTRKDIKLTAKWTANTYTIKFDGNGAKGKMKALKNCAYDKEYILTANQFKKADYTFAGWNTKKDGKGTSYSDKAAVKNLTDEKGKTIILYAQWKAAGYEVKFDGNGATSGKMKDLSGLKAGKTYKLAKNQFKRTGYIFTGWNTKKDGSGKAFKNRAKIKDLTGKKGKPVTLYAQWKPVVYAIRFDGNGATGGNMEEIKGCLYDKNYKLPANAFQKTGFKFSGWSTQKNGKGKVIKDKAKVKNLTDKKGSVVILYAQWKKN